MKSLKTVLTFSTIFAFLTLAFTPFPGFAQQMGAKTQGQQHMAQKMIQNSMQQRTPQLMSQGMNQNMVSMNKMMRSMQEIMGKTSKMLQGMHNSGQYDVNDHALVNRKKMMAGKDEIKKLNKGNNSIKTENYSKQPLMNVVHGMDEMAKSMNKVMVKMHKIMSDKTIMDNPEMQKQMQEMQKPMESLTSDFDRVIKNVDKLQKGKEK